jgi:hypothetical protein
MQDTLSPGLRPTARRYPASYRIMTGYLILHALQWLRDSEAGSWLLLLALAAIAWVWSRWYCRRHPRRLPFVSRDHPAPFPAEILPPETWDLQALNKDFPAERAVAHSEGDTGTGR